MLYKVYNILCSFKKCKYKNNLIKHNYYITIILIIFTSRLKKFESVFEIIGVF